MIEKKYIRYQNVSRVSLDVKMAFRFDEMYSELSEMVLIRVPNIDVLKSRSKLFKTVLCLYDNTDNSSINVDLYIDYFKNELPAFIKNDPTLIECNRNLVKDIGNNLKTIHDFKSAYPLSFLIVAFHYYVCKDLESELVQLIATTPGRHLSKIMDHLFVVCDYSESVRLFVERTNI